MSRLPRLQLFEFNDSPYAPASLRDLIVETLSVLLDRVGAIRSVAPVVSQFLEESGTDQVLDLCAGAGGPAALLCQAMQDLGVTPPHILETDLFPRPGAWQRAATAFPEHIDFIETPVDATRIDPALSAGRARIIFNAFHHFPPDLAEAIVQSAVRDRAPFMLVEPFGRNPIDFFVPLSLPGVGALLRAPITSAQDRRWKALWTWFTPVALGAGLWDSVVSSLRVYEAEELRAMLGDAANYRFEHGIYHYGRGGRGTYVYGIPQGDRGRPR